MITLAEKAIETYEELTKIRDEEEATRIKESRERQMEAGRQYFRDVFKEEPVWNDEGIFMISAFETVPLPDDENDIYERRQPIAPPEENPFYPEIGLGFGSSHGQHFNILGKCTRCGHVVSIGDVRSLYDLGYFLRNWSIPYHECPETAIQREPVRRPEDILRDYIDACETLLDNGGPYDKIEARLRIVEASALLLIAERLRREE